MKMNKKSTEIKRFLELKFMSFLFKFKNYVQAAVSSSCKEGN